MSSEEDPVCLAPGRSLTAGGIVKCAKLIFRTPREVFDPKVIGRSSVLLQLHLLSVWGGGGGEGASGIIDNFFTEQTGLVMTLPHSPAPSTKNILA